MKKLAFLVFVWLSVFTVVAFAQEKSLLIDDFEVVFTAGPDGTVDAGAGNGSSVEVAAATDIKRSGKQAMKVTYNALAGGYIWVARGYGLDAKNSDWLVKPENIDWKNYSAISFYVYGSDSKTKVAFDIKDSGNEIWRYIFEDNFQGWKQIVCPFNEFFARSDWQPDNAEKNSQIDFPIKSYQFEPLPESKGILYFEDVELISK